MFTLLASAFLLIAFGSLAWLFFSRMRALGAGSAETARGTTTRYRPMLRLLSEDDFGFLGSNPGLCKTLRAERRKLFRSYLRCLEKDYAGLLACVRLAMVQSGLDRPDLARALARNRALFAVAICKIELRLALHASGTANVDISGLVGAFETLRTEIAGLTPASVAA
jgi:uncharacterized membrane protein